MEMPAKLTKRVYTFDTPQGEQTIEKYTLIGGPDPSTLTDDALAGEGLREFGRGTVLKSVQDFAREVNIEFQD